MASSLRISSRRAAGFLELQVGGGGAHPAFQFLDIGAQVVADEVVALVVLDIDHHPVAAGRIGDDIVDVALDAFGRDAVKLVIGRRCFSRRRSVSAMARSMLPVIRSA